MKKIILLILGNFIMASLFQLVVAQDTKEKIEIGYRIKDAKKAIIVYRATTNLSQLGDPIVLRSSVYFILLENSLTLKSKKFQLISIPGKNIDNNHNNKEMGKTLPDLNTIGQTDFDHSFWMPSEYIDDGEINENFQLEYSHSKVSVTVLAVPFKYRLSSKGPEGKTFTTEATIGTSIGYRIFNNYKYDYGLSIGIGGGVTTFNRSIADSNDPTKQIQQSFLGFSVVPAIIFNTGDIQMGFVFGWDFASVDPEWTYNAKPWISFSVGYSFFNLFKNKSN
jgi:hypothetical protein